MTASADAVLFKPADADPSARRRDDHVSAAEAGREADDRDPRREGPGRADDSGRAPARAAARRRTRCGGAQAPAARQRAPAAEARGGGGGGRGRGGPPTASMAAGLNSVTWDLAYPGATTFPGMVLWGATTNGPPALPGNYQVRLTVDGKTQTQPLVVKRHPLRDGHRRRPAGAVRPRDPDPRQGQRSEQRRHPDPQHQGARSTDRLTKSQDAQLKAAGDRADDEPERRRGRDLPGAEPERPGSAQLPDQDQQPPRVAARRRERAATASRSPTPSRSSRTSAPS